MEVVRFGLRFAGEDDFSALQIAPFSVLTPAYLRCMACSECDAKSDKFPQLPSILDIILPGERALENWQMLASHRISRSPLGDIMSTLGDNF